MTIAFRELNGIQQPCHLGQVKGYFGEFTFDNSYAAGGEPIVNATGLRSNNVIGIDFVGGNARGRGLTGNFDYAANKIQLISRNAGQVVNYTPGGGDIKGATNLAGTEGNADQASTPVNTGLYKTAAAFSGLAKTLTPTAQPASARNLVLTINNPSGGALNLFDGTITFTITGFDPYGAAQTETKTLVSNAGNKAIAAGKCRIIQSSKAWGSVTTITWDNDPADTALTLALGPGTRFFLFNGLENAATTDVLKLSVNAANVAISGTATSAGGVDTTNNTINSGTIADGDDVAITYRAGSQEEIAATDLSALKLRAIVYIADNPVS